MTAELMSVWAKQKATAYDDIIARTGISVLRIHVSLLPTCLQPTMDVPMKWSVLIFYAFKYEAQTALFKLLATDFFFKF